MRDRKNGSPSSPPPGLGRRIAQARFNLAWETIWPALWPALGIAGTFAALALLDFFAALPGWLHALVLAATAAGFGYTLYRAFRMLVLPSQQDALRRIELASGLEHRPLEALQDTLPAGQDDPTTRALWEAHRRQMADRIRALKVGAPSPGLPARDPWALRAIVVLLLVVGVVVAGPERAERLERAFVPAFDTGSAQRAAKLEIWLTPPEYTRLPPIFPVQVTRDHAQSLETVAETARMEGREPPAAAELVIEVPAGSTLTAVVSGGGGGDATLDIDGEKTPFEALDKVNRRLQQPVEKSGRLLIAHDGKTLGSWKIRIRPDTPPTIAFDGPPGATQRGTLRLAYKGGDDYGITEIRGEMRRTYERGEVIGKEVSGFELPAPSLDARKVREATFHEIAPHPWAGLPVIIRLSAKDAAGQVAYSEEVKLVLPERKFNNPVAKEIIAERRRLTTQPERRPEIVDRLNEIAGGTQAYKDDTVVFLGLISSRSRLVHEKADTAIPPVRNLLWDTALRVEDGQLSHAERELLRAQEALMKALARNASDRELEQLMRELQNAMNRFMRELAKKLQSQQNANDAMPFDPTNRIMRTSDMQRMMDQIRQMMRAGSRDAARQMLSQLRNMLESLRNARVMRSNPQAQRGNEALRQLQEMIRRQGDLMDQTFRQSQGRNPGESQMQRGAREQQQLRDMLKQFQKMMQGMMPGKGKGMQSLGQAGKAMEDAARALGNGQPGQAVGPQGQALEALRRAGRGMIRQMMNQFARGSGIGFGRDFNPLRGMRDPLGRDWGDEDQDGVGDDMNRVKIPDIGTIERVQDILNELRNRAGQRHRPQIELDYIERLLRRF
ncbi:MAG: TIGR02302 family protein [Alphaproteobacteria bacterium]